MGPALPVLLLAASLLQQDGFFPDKRGEWGQRVDVAVRADYAVPATQARAFGERLGTLAGVLRGAAVFNPPLGIQPRFAARWWVPRECSAGLASCRNRPVQAQVGVILYYFVADRNGQPSWGGEANTSAGIWINDPLATFVSAGSYDVIGAPYLPLPDGRHIAFMPRKTGELGGFPLYDDDLLIVTRGTRPWWVPVTRQQYLEAMIRHTQDDLDRDQKRLATVSDPYVDWLKKAEERRRTRE
jgi:hypothetical protein